LEAGGGDGNSGDGVVKARRASFGVWVDVLFPSGKPAGLFEAGEHGVEGAAGHAGEAHNLEAVAGLGGVFEEDLEDLGHLWGDVEVMHAGQCMSST
jgi:hypothetical protein